MQSGWCVSENLVVGAADHVAYLTLQLVALVLRDYAVTSPLPSALLIAKDRIVLQVIQHANSAA